jgi:hypothetical protein
MPKPPEIPWNKKLALLRKHDFGGLAWSTLDDKAWCLHCGRQFSGHQVRVACDAAGRLSLECGTPKCTGSPIDWAPYPWWDENHPTTKENKGKPSRRKRRRKGKPGGDDVPF